MIKSMNNSDKLINKEVDKIIHEELSQEIPTFIENLTDFVAHFGGSWTFIVLFSVFFSGWIFFNLFVYTFDSFPFILLNLILSCLAVFQAPFILMSQNRMSDIDRTRELRAYKIAIKAEMEISDLHEKLDKLLELQQKKN